MSIINRPGAFSTRNAQFCKFCPSRVIRSFQSTILKEEVFKGTPKYFIGNAPILNPSVLARNVSLGSLVLKKYTFDLSVLTRVPEASINVFRTFKIVHASLTDAWQNKRISSSNCWWVKERVGPHKFNPCNYSFFK